MYKIFPHFARTFIRYLSDSCHEVRENDHEKSGNSNWADRYEPCTLPHSQHVNYICERPSILFIRRFLCTYLLYSHDNDSTRHSACTGTYNMGCTCVYVISLLTRIRKDHCRDSQKQEGLSVNYMNGCPYCLYRCTQLQGILHFASHIIDLQREIHVHHLWWSLLVF